MKQLDLKFQKEFCCMAYLELAKLCLLKPLQTNAKFLLYIAVEVTLLNFMLETVQEKSDNFLKMPENTNNVSSLLMKLIVWEMQDTKQDSIENQIKL